MSGDLYLELIAGQVRGGHLGGKNGQFGYLVKKQKEPKPTPIPKIEFSFTIFDGTISEAHDDNGLCDPYVVFNYVKPDGKQKAFYRSSVCRKTLTPHWDEKGSYQLKKNVKQLVITLWDQDLLKKNDYIGSATIDFQSIIQDKPLNGKVDFFDDSKKLGGTIGFYLGQTVKIDPL
ncbi:hypothetical protein ACTA71_000282 [Dictyostelium dimigraforme]